MKCFEEMVKIISTLSSIVLRGSIRQVQLLENNCFTIQKLNKTAPIAEPIDTKVTIADMLFSSNLNRKNCPLRSKC